MALRYLSLVAAAAFTALAYPTQTQVQTRESYLEQALNATNLMTTKWYNESSGRFDTFWWQSASIISTLAELSSLEEDVYDHAHYFFKNTFVRAPRTNNGSWLNEYYDDEGWWALAWIKVYDMTKDSHYLETAKLLFEDMRGGLGSDCGGLWWSKDKTYTSTISNQLFFATAASLANRMPIERKKYQEYAADSLQWLRKSGLITNDHTFMDGRDALDGCKLVGPAWTYNQGVILGGLVEYYKLTKDKSMLNFAHRVAHGTIDHLTDKNGVLTEDGYPKPLNEDRAIFKGIFMRNLVLLHQASPDDEYVTFIQRNAHAIAKKGRAKNGLIGPNWQGPIRAPYVTTQAAAADCFIAAAAVTPPTDVQREKSWSESKLQKIMQITRLAGMR